MSLRPATPGATRICPHCKAQVLESAAICPGCRHHLRFNAGASLPGDDEGYRALSIEGTIAHQPAGEACEYCIILDMRDEKGEQVARQVVAVGALQPGERRHLNVSVGVRPVKVGPVLKPQPAAAMPAPPTPARWLPATNVAAKAVATPEPAPSNASGQRSGLFRKL